MKRTKARMAREILRDLSAQNESESSSRSGGSSADGHGGKGGKAAISRRTNPENAQHVMRPSMGTSAAGSFARVGGEPGLDSIPDLAIDDREMLALEAFSVVGNPSDIDRVAEQVVEVAAALGGHPNPDLKCPPRTFLRNHRDLIAGMDFFVAPIARFTLLYVWFVLDHGRRRALHVDVTSHPTAGWVVQQLRDAFPNHPRHRHLIIDNDAIFSPEVAHSISSFGIHPRRTALQSPSQNGTAERFAGNVRRELFDHVAVLGEDHLRRLIREYVEYYNAERVHTSIGDAPEGCAIQAQPSERAKVMGLPRVGGLHHRYVWAVAA